jgi:hypothetical protein
MTLKRGAGANGLDSRIYTLSARGRSFVASTAKCSQSAASGPRGLSKEIANASILHRPKCSKTNVNRPFGGWGGFQISILLLFLNNKLLDLQLHKVVESSFAPSDFILNPFVEKRAVNSQEIEKMQNAVAFPFYVVNVCLVVLAVDVV